MVELKSERLLQSTQATATQIFGAQGFLAKSRSLGGMVMWVAVLLFSSLFLYYLL